MNVFVVAVVTIADDISESIMMGRHPPIVRLGPF